MASSPKEILTLEKVSTMFLFHFRAIQMHTDADY
ncbi:hypothetical protein PanWU01x14_182150 [Parasponia andersonii]|uniref:Uncharacterized protein n=1 Tax=Parasponia andersonii TaxID=3476 RepID=A0A2P5C5X2_PARAD|nr:hypothetical protein PanWU01x14_182150 [Parasponia andersonii]